MKNDSIIPVEAIITMDSIRIPFIGRKDKKGFDYYFTRTHIPMLLDLSDAVIHLFPYDQESSFGLDFVFRKYDPDYKQRLESNLIEHPTKEEMELIKGDDSSVASQFRSRIRNRPSKNNQHDPEDES
jgi:hypothetical protein